MCPSWKLSPNVFYTRRKLKDRSGASLSTESAMTSRKTFRPKSIKCHYCGKLGHIKKNCQDFKAEKEGRKEKKDQTSEGSYHNDARELR